MVELRIGAGIFAVGFMIFTILCKIAIPLIQSSQDLPEGPIAARPAPAPAV
jgi:hypothetical protein